MVALSEKRSCIPSPRSANVITASRLRRWRVRNGLAGKGVDKKRLLVWQSCEHTGKVSHNLQRRGQKHAREGN